MSDHATNLKDAARVQGKIEKIGDKYAAKITKIEAKAKAAIGKALESEHAAVLELIASLAPEVSALLSKPEEA